VQTVTADVDQRPWRSIEASVPAVRDSLIQRAGNHDRNENGEQPHLAIVRRLPEVRKLWP
jgi:hypothetical protein